MINIQTNCFPAICISFKDRIKDQIDKEIFETFLSQKEKLTIRNVRCILVGCGGAGKTTLLGRLKNETYKDLKNIETTELVDVHANNFVVYENENTIKSMFLFSFFYRQMQFFQEQFHATDMLVQASQLDSFKCSFSYFAIVCRCIYLNFVVCVNVILFELFIYVKTTCLLR